MTFAQSGGMRNDFQKEDCQGENPFAKGCSAHGDQCLCAGIKLIEGKGH